MTASTLAFAPAAARIAETLFRSRDSEISIQLFTKGDWLLAHYAAQNATQTWQSPCTGTDLVNVRGESSVENQAATRRRWCRRVCDAPPKLHWRTGPTSTCTNWLTG